MTIDLQQYSQFLICPACRSKVVVDAHQLVCRSADCRLRYDVKDDIPVMLADEAHAVPLGEWQGVIQRASST